MSYGTETIRENILSLIVIVVICGAIVALQRTLGSSDVAQVTQSAANVQATLTAVTPEPVSLTEFTSKLMGNCHAKLSEGKAHLLASQIARISEATFGGHRDQQEAFVLLICIESAFQNTVKSKVGAVGYTQIMQKNAIEFSTTCGVGPATVADLDDGEVNLTLGACFFRRLLDSFDGNVGLALAAYNSGQFSDTTKKAARLESINPETANYLGKFLVLREIANKN